VPPLTLALLVLAAFTGGTVDAIAGGGGLITLPALLAAHVPPTLALGTNKGQSTWGSGAALVAYWRADRVDRKLAPIAFPLGLAGAAIGARLVLALDPDVLRPLVIALLVGAAVLLLVKKPSRDEDEPARRRHMIIAAALAFAIAMYDGFFGPGTGTFLIVGFVAWCGKTPTRATADAKVVNFAANLAALVTFASAGAVIWSVSLPMAAGQLCGGVLGARLAIRGGAKLVRASVLVVSGVLVAKLVYQLVS
jgi:hypothetical protein